MVSVHEVFFAYGHKCYIAIMTVENLSGRRVQHLLRPVGFNSQSTAGYISYPGKCHSNVIRCFKCFKCNFFQCFIDRFCRGGGMSWKFSKKEEKKCPMTGRTLKCFINDCCFLCWHNFLLFDLMLIFKFFISATPLILPNIYQNILFIFIIECSNVNY